MLVAPSPDLAGLGKAIEAGGASLSVVALGRESLLVVGKMGLPGSGVGARLALTGATLVRRISSEGGLPGAVDSGHACGGG